MSLLELKNITKAFPGVVALNNVSLHFEPGQIHAIMGENGAGKSTLIRIISGAETPDSGTISINGTVHTSITPAISRAAGIEVVYQEFNLVPGVSVAENVFLGDKLGGRFFQNFKEMNRSTAEVFRSFGIEISPRQSINELSNSHKQLVEIAKALTKNAKILILDEPSSALAAHEANILLEIVTRLRKQGICVIYISHRMDEIFRIADCISVLRDGEYIATKPASELTRDSLIELMVGRKLKETYPHRAKMSEDVVLDVENLTGNGVYDINFKLHKKEILGIAGLVGAGRTELAKLIYGAAKREKGHIRCLGKEISAKHPVQAIAAGIGLIPEDRKGEGVFLEFPIDWNISITALKPLSKYMFIDRKKVDEVSFGYAKKLRIKAPDLSSPVKTLSGGNQQKVALAKTLAGKNDILLFDEPTRGIDVGAKQEIYKLMSELTNEGISIVMITSEMEELMGMSDRIIVMHEGRISGELERHEFSQEKILALASGIKDSVKMEVPS